MIDQTSINYDQTHHASLDNFHQRWFPRLLDIALCTSIGSFLKTNVQKLQVLYSVHVPHVTLVS